MPEKVKIYRNTGDEAELWAVDAQRAVVEHKDEWAYQPFPKATVKVESAKAVKEAQAKVDAAKQTVADAKNDTDKAKAEQLLSDAQAELDRVTAAQDGGKG